MPKKLALALIMALPLAACEAPVKPISTEDGGANDRTVDLMAVAPDGTHLWRFNTGGRPVYFASTGAQWEERCGKRCRRDVQVPTAMPSDPLEAAGQ